MNGLRGNAARAGGIAVLTAAMFGLLDDGDENQDATKKLQGLAKAAAEKGLPVRLGARVYLTDGTTIEFQTPVSGTGTKEGDTLIKSTARSAAGHVVKMSGSGAIENLRIDGSASADPKVWNARNYDSFVGSEGLLVDADRVTIKNVVVQNVRRAGFKVELGHKKIAFENCRAVRCRGNFGDGFLVMASEDVEFRNCHAYDFTRIGFVADTYGEAPGTFCAAIRYQDCSAEYGHNASILHGGGEYNAGWWGEQSHGVSHANCRVKNVTHRGFTGTTGHHLASLNAPADYRYDRCTVSRAESGFVVVGLGNVPIKAVLTDCSAEIEGSTGFGAGEIAGDHVYLKNCKSRLSGSSDIRVSLRVGVGEVVVEGFTETWVTLNPAARDNIERYCGSVGHFNSSPRKVSVKDWKTFDNEGRQIGTVYKFLWSASDSLDLTIEGGLVRGVLTICKSFAAQNVDFERVNYLRASERAVIRGGRVGSQNALPAFVVMKSTKNVILEDVLLNFERGGGYLYLYNMTSDDPRSKISLNRCAIVKDFASAGYAIRINGDPPYGNVADHNQITLTDCMFVNTGGITRNSIFHIEGATAAKIVGRGNRKSASLRAITSSSRIGNAAQFEDWG